MTTTTETRPDGRAVGRDIVSWLTGDRHGLELGWLCIRYSGFEPRALALLNALETSELAYPDPVRGLRFYGHPDAIRLGLDRLGLDDELLDIRHVRPGH